jgi:hypothetical protein
VAWVSAIIRFALGATGRVAFDKAEPRERSYQQDGYTLTEGLGRRIRRYIGSLSTDSPGQPISPGRSD